MMKEAMVVKRAVFSLIAVSFLMGLISLFPSPVHAAVKLEQQINIIDQEYSTAQSARPTDNSLGLIHWDGTKYNGETVYFEAVIRCDLCSGGSNQVTAGLYTAAGALVTNSSVSTGNSTYTLAQSVSAITGNLVNGTDYTVRLTRDSTAGTAYIKAARLVILQSAASLTDSETQIEIGNASITGNTAYELVGAPKIMNYVAANYSPSPAIYFEATLTSSHNSSVAYAALSASPSCATVVSGSEVTVTGTSWTLIRSVAPISLTSGTNYFVCIKTDAGQTASIANAKLVLDQTNALGITDLETYQQSVNTQATHADATYTSQDFLNTYDAAHFSGARFNYFFESTLSASGDTGYAQLYDLSNSTALANSEIPTTNSSYAILRSQEITAGLPDSASRLDTQIKNSLTSFTYVSSSWLVVDLHAYPQFSFSLEGVPGNIVTNGITTSIASQGNSLDFSTLTPGTPKYMAHKLSTVTNLSSGYSVSMKLRNTLQGNYPANVIDSFPASWSSPQSWTSPTGITANVNTGWLGANTSDTRIAGWAAAAGLFGPVGTTAEKVMASPGIDPGTSVYVTYVIEANQYQPTDVYLGTLIYDVIPTY